MKYLIYVCIFLLSVVPVAYARDGADDGPDHDATEIENEETEDEFENHQNRNRGGDVKRREAKEEFKEKKDAFKNEFKADKEKLKAEKDLFKNEWERTATHTKEELKMKMENIRTQIKDRRTEMRAKIASSTAEIKAKFDQMKKNRIEQRLENVDGKFDAAIVRLEQFDMKVEAALKRFEERGVDVSSVSELLATARESLNEAKKLQTDFKAKTNALLDEDEVSRVELRTEAEVIIDAIKATRAAYVDVVAELRASNENKDDNDDNSN